jgi:hypothetical protein
MLPLLMSVATTIVYDFIGHNLMQIRLKFKSKRNKSFDVFNVRVDISYRCDA